MRENLPKQSGANFSLYPFLWLAFCFAFGIVAAKFFDFPWHFCFAACLSLFFLALIFQKRKVCLYLVFAAFVFAGGLCYRIEKGSIAETRIRKIYDRSDIKSGEPVEIEGVLRGKPELAADGFFLVLESEKIIYKNVESKASGKIRLFASIQNQTIANEYDRLNLAYGTRLRVACRLNRDERFSNPGGLSQKEILDEKNTDATGTIKSPLLIEKISDSETFAPMAWIYERRQDLIKEFRDKFDSSTAGVLIASLLGNKYFLDKQTAEVFREGGTFHVLVISGLHITFIGGLTLLFLRFFTNKKFWQFVIASAFLWAYSLAVGADVPVVRATVMFTILLFSQVIYRNGTLLNALGFCAFVLLVWKPSDLFTQSFQLTFVSVSAIVAMAFPLVEKLRAVGEWTPSAEEPFPPNVSNGLKRFCETIYWRDAIWNFESSRHIWSANLFKLPYFKWRENSFLQKPLRFVFEAILVSLVVQIWMLPLTVVYFHRLSFLAVFLNLWVGVVIALESFAAIFALLFAQIHEIPALPLIKLTEFFNWLLVEFPRLFTENDWASVRLPHYAGAGISIYFLYFVPVIFAAFALNAWKPFATDAKFRFSNFKIFGATFLRLNAAIFLILLAIAVFHPLSAPRADGKLRIDFLDVGQGDSALVTFPDGETMLVDGGGKPNFNRPKIKNEDGEQREIFEPDTQSIGETVVSRFLWEKGYDRVDYILATHADADHIQGLADAAKNFKVKAAFFARTPFADADFAELYKVLQRREIEVLIVSRGDVLNFAGTKIEVLFPAKDENPQAASDNNHSLVLRLIFGSRKILLTGDIEKEAENELLQAPEFLLSDVVKVAHHGSRTSSTDNFINAARPKLAVISVGKQSQFGHPHDEIVRRWLDSGARVLTTGENGTITISTDGENLLLETFNEKKIFR